MITHTSIARVWRSAGRGMLSAVAFPLLLGWSFAFAQKSPQLWENLLSWVETFPWDAGYSSLEARIDRRALPWRVVITPHASPELRRKKQDCEREATVICYEMDESGGIHVIWARKCCAYPISDCGLWVDECVQDGLCARVCGKGTRISWPLPASQRSGMPWEAMLTLLKESSPLLPTGTRAKVFFHGEAGGAVVVDSMYIFFPAPISTLTKMLSMTVVSVSSDSDGKNCQQWSHVCRQEDCNRWSPQEAGTYIAYMGYASEKGIAKRKASLSVEEVWIGPNPTFGEVRVRLSKPSSFRVWVHEGMSGEQIDFKEVKESEGVELILPRPGAYWITVEVNGERRSELILRQ